MASADISPAEVIKELRAKLHAQEVVINTLRGMLFTAWTLTNSYEHDEDGDRVCNDSRKQL